MTSRRRQRAGPSSGPDCLAG